MVMTTIVVMMVMMVVAGGDDDDDDDDHCGSKINTDDVGNKKNNFRFLFRHDFVDEKKKGILEIKTKECYRILCITLKFSFCFIL